MRLEWGELATRLGLSRSMLDMVRKGQRNLSFKALDRLEQAELEAGIFPPQPASEPPRSEPGTDSIKNLSNSGKGSGKGIDWEEVRKTIDELKRLTADLERIYKRK